MKSGVLNSVITVLLVVLFSGCGSGKGTFSPEQLETSRKLIMNKAFEFDAQWAIPISSQDMTVLMNAGLLRPGDAPNRINLMGNRNFLSIHGDTVRAYLPFYGEQQMHVSLNPQDQAIQFDEVVNDLQVNFSEEKNQYEIRFSASQGIQGYVVFLTVFPNLQANLRVNSSSRDFIAYQGEIKPLEPSPEKKQ
ncbi:DUF4251 domain-containing protein [Robertkochia flava]|uniref:DUF4251 domain-containing protein n=1 Tax=Robertkochia flava TaxID=3447986 RepID=UPI001CD032A9|nr:DUF4251 domain-containing protein [Robertkochia marina]